MSLIAETANPLLEQALLTRLHPPGGSGGGLGKLEPVALRLGMLQNSLKPTFHDPQLILFAADHGLAVEGIHTVQGQPTDEQVAAVLSGKLPVAVFARQLGLPLSVIDCGMSSPMPTHDRLVQRKIAHGTRNARVGAAMSLDNAHAAIRAGMEIGDGLSGNLVACAGLGVGSHEAAALVLARLSDSAVQNLLSNGPTMNPDLLGHVVAVAQSALGRHRELTDPVEVLAAFGGFETAVMVGVMLVAASKRHLVLVDGITACAALMVASRISPPVTDYAVFCRSQQHRGVDEAMALFEATAMLELGLDTTDGAGACLSWPIVRAAAALLADAGDTETDIGNASAADLMAATVPMPQHPSMAPTQPNELPR